jgi:hypothetical protein
VHVPAGGHARHEQLASDQAEVGVGVDVGHASYSIRHLEIASGFRVADTVDTPLPGLLTFSKSSIDSWHEPRRLPHLW